MFGLTGTLLEEEVFTKIEIKWEGYMKYQDSLSQVINNQPHDWNPSDPPTRAGSDLYTRVAMSLEEIIGDFNWSDELKLYTALKSPLDFYHGIDGMFSFRGKIVTIDVTMNPHKDRYKADVIVFCPETNSDNIDFYGIPEIAQKLLSVA